ncbi:STM3941 family protein [Qipengyuania flava]|uniref:STM3941 family protein n=1 Tax=Qipengyuania flava TaxID=192812 RepID=UPI001C62657C|nr:STM3941 family protein [Qipengyuania flava]QYJ06236.1 hypothetical protein KUV82_09080 [Qipengyuania flava]
MGDERDAFVARYSRWRLCLLLLLSLGFVVGGLWMLEVFGELGEPSPRRPFGTLPRAAYPYVGALNVAFFGWAAIIALRRIFLRQDAVRISASGIWTGQHYSRAFAWDEVTTINPAPPIIRFEVTEGVRKGLPVWLRAYGAINRSLMGSSFAISLGSLDANKDEMIDAIVRYAPPHLTGREG